MLSFLERSLPLNNIKAQSYQEIMTAGGGKGFFSKARTLENAALLWRYSLLGFRKKDLTNPCLKRFADLQNLLDVKAG